MPAGKQPPIPPPKPKAGPKDPPKEEAEPNQPVEKEKQKEEAKIEEEEVAKEPEKTGQKRSLDDLYAAAREEFDLDLSPTESALKTLKEGREMQKLSVVRNLGDLLEAEPGETMEKVVPRIQELLNVEPSDLDMHCEAAVVYKNCIREKKMEAICPDLTERLLVAILENIERQKENVTAAAWLESLLDVAECVPQKSVTNMIVPVAIAQADSGRRVQRRVISTRLIEKLATLVSREIVQRELCPCVQMLCQDPSTAVRTSIAQRLSILAQALNNSADCCALLLPCIIELCKDEDPVVREAILGSLDVCLPHFSKDAKKTCLLPLIRKCSEQALILRDASLPVISRHFGSWLQCLRDILTASDLRWWMDTYTRILDFAWHQNDQKQGVEGKEEGGQAAEQAKGQANYEPVRTMCRRMCAFNFPCIVSIFGEEREVFSERLMPILERFCRDPDEEVRSTVASGFHEILAHRKNVPASKAAGGEQPQLFDPFLELLSSGSSEVVQHLTGNLEKILPILYKESGTAGGSSKKTPAVMAKLNRLNQMLLSCNSLLRASGSWRAHEAYLNSLAVLRNLVLPKVLKQSFLPLLRQEVLSARALPCRVAAAQSLLLMMRELPMARDRQAVVDFFLQDIGQHQSCYRRRLLLDIVPALLRHFSREFFIDKFLASILKLSLDPISNIRLQLCRTLPAIKKYLAFPKDDQSLSSLERVVRELLASEQNPFSRQLIQQFACELSRAETDQKESRMNKTKLAEEKQLWTEREEEKGEAEEAGRRKEAEKERTRRGRRSREEPNSPESGIFIDEEMCAGQKAPRGLVRSATTANIPEVQIHLPCFMPLPSPSSGTIAGMAIESSSSSSSSSARSASRRPPVPSSSSWRTSRPASAAPKLAIVRPQPQVTVTQRSCSPMPPSLADRRASFEGTEKEAEAFDAGASARNSKLPLSTARYRSPAFKPSPGSQVQQLASKFMGNDGTEPVTDSLKLKKYKPKEVMGQGNTSWAKSPQRMLQQSATPPPSSPARRSSSSASTSSASPSASPSSSAMSRSASAVPGTTSSQNGPVPLQSSASSSSLNGRAGRRPYGLMKVQSTSSAVERKPAQIRCQVISMT